MNRLVSKALRAEGALVRCPRAVGATRLLNVHEYVSAYEPRLIRENSIRNAMDRIIPDP
jgi:hypothetical protein